MSDNEPSGSPDRTEDLRALAASANINKHSYKFDHPDRSYLERFKNPHPETDLLRLAIEAPEFTSLCPITGQPDFATIKVNYIPDDWCVESKSFKLYLMGFRNYGEFHEACVSRICKDLSNLLEPMWLQVIGEFSPRGGIKFWPTAEYSKTDREYDTHRGITSLAEE